MGAGASSPSALLEHLEQAIGAFETFPPVPCPPPEAAATIASAAAQEGVAAWLARQGLPVDRPLDPTALCSTVWAALSSGPGAAVLPPTALGSSRASLERLVGRLAGELAALPKNAEAARDAVEVQLASAARAVRTEAEGLALIATADVLGAALSAAESRKGATLEAEALTAEAALEALGAAAGPVRAALRTLPPADVAALHPAVAANLAQLCAMLRGLGDAEPAEDAVVRLAAPVPPAPFGAIVTAAVTAADVVGVAGLEPGWIVRPGGTVAFDLALRADAAGGAGASALVAPPPPAASALARRLTVVASLEPLAPEGGGGRRGGVPLPSLVTPDAGGRGVRVTLRVPPAPAGAVAPRHRVVISALALGGEPLPGAPPLPVAIDVLPPGWRRESRRVGWGGPGGEPFDDAAACGGLERVRRVAAVTITWGTLFGTPCVGRLAVRYELHDGREVLCEHGEARAAAGAERAHTVLGAGERIGRVYGSTMPHGSRQVFALGVDVVSVATGAVLRSVESAGARVQVDTSFSEAADVVAFAGRAGDVLDRLEVVLGGGRVHGEGGAA